mgnify:CR=1 FL=1
MQSLALITFVLSEHEISVLDQVSFTGEQIDPNDFPGMIGYIVQPGDNLLVNSKKNIEMSIERIREVNQDKYKSRFIKCDRFQYTKRRKIARRAWHKARTKTSSSAIREL